MSGGNGGGLAAPTPPPGNPMPVLNAEVREALKASIREFGVICPVIKDQTGFVLDGWNRIEIATELGVTYPEIVYTCTPDQREILRIELNGARRQITAKQWKPLVDHLRSLRTSSGHKYSERAIAQAVGVARTTIQREHPLPVKSSGPSGPLASETVQTGKDGRTQHSNPQWTATDRVLHLIRQSTTGLTASDLRADSVLAGFGASTVSKIPTALHERGLIQPAGKRDRSTVWVAATNPVTPPKAPKPPTSSGAQRKAAQILEGLQDPTVREAVKEGVADGKATRAALTALAAAERELEAAQLDAEKREAASEKERLRMIEVHRQSASTSIKTWETLAAEVKAAWVMIAAYSKIIDDLPAIHPAFERTLARELTELRRQLDRLEDRLNPGRDREPVKAGTIIDVG